ncbi:MAG: hypothetical protein DMF61_16910 [Blastocatellia bacterium AA13]|nr:MAG: hypothetical protein DMF61_16910 [Blastocatellia bacterium AA13]
MEETNPATLQRGPLHDVEAALGAKFEVLNGWAAPAVFSDPVAEHSRVRNAVGLIDKSERGMIRVSGGEATQFLNGLLTNDVKTLPQGRWLNGAFLTAHGKVRALCSIYNLGDSFLIVNDRSTHQKVWSLIFPFSYAGDFKVEDVSDQYAVLAIEGPHALPLIKELCFEPMSQMDDYEWRSTKIAGASCIISRASSTGETGFQVICDATGVSEVWEFSLMKGAFHEISPVGREASESLRVEAGIPIYGVDIDEANMLLECGLPDYVSFSKGCYVGQEAVAMATYRGHISKKLCGIFVDAEAPPPAGAKLFEGEKEVGHVTTSILSPTLNRVICLGYVKYGFFEAGTHLSIQSGSQNLGGEITALPFYKSANL